MIKLTDILCEMKINKPFSYDKAYGESHSYNEYKSNNDKRIYAPDFFVDVNNGKILASFSAWNIPSWAYTLNKNAKDSGYGIYNIYILKDPPPYVDLPGPLNPKDPNNWESNLSKVRSFAKNLDN